MLEEITPYDFYKNFEAKEDDSLGCTTLIMPDEKFTFLNFPYINNKGIIKSFLGKHEYTAYEIIKEQYGLDIFEKNLDKIINEDVRNISLDERIKKETDLKELTKLVFDETKEKIKPFFDHAQNELETYVPGGIKNAIMISYVLQNVFQFITITIPSYITSYQAEQLEEVNEELKEIKKLLKEKGNDDPFLIGITVEDFNPLTHQKDESIEEFRINNDTDGEDNIKNGKINDPIKYILEYMKVTGRINDNIKNSFRQNVKVGSRRI